MPTTTAGIHGAVCGPRIASVDPSTAPRTAWTAPRLSPWPWSQQQARGMRLWAATPPSRHATKQCWCPRPRSTSKPHVPLLGYRYHTHCTAFMLLTPISCVFFYPFLAERIIHFFSYYDIQSVNMCESCPVKSSHSKTISQGSQQNHF